ncbi:GNAT family N-acetyltransferase [Nonomuraea sp. NPDC050556]|uniref:GNAT family N-acetyltransferase n=1 Tax=Nonomuraea sp. NPDC050556 TaxID=3364369 RepID=UPI0037A91847
MEATLVTRRLRLLPLQVSHAEEMAVVLSDPALHTFIGGTPATVEALRARYTRMIAGSPAWCNWVIELDGHLVGTVQATIGPDDAEIAWVVGTPWQGQGIAKEAAMALVAWLRGQGAGVITAHIHPDHHASAAVAVAVGLTPTDVTHDGEILWRFVSSREPGEAP